MTPEPPYVRARPALRRVVEWAAAMHATQRREVDSAPFILHPLEVAALLHGRGFDDDVVAAGVLHDAVENTPATIDDVRSLFGARIADLVAAVTEDDAIEDYEQRKASLRDRVMAAGPDALAVFVADKIAKARELRAQVGHRSDWRDDPKLRARLDHYDESLRMLRAADAHPRMTDQLEFELWALRALPPQPRP